MEIQFKKGVYKLNEQSNFDFQLNRIVMWDGGDLEEIEAVGPKIRTSEDWKRELIALGDRAVSEGRTENAIAYYRMSEFFMYDGDQDKKAYYVKATQMFYDYYKPVFDNGEVKCFEVPYEDVKLPVMAAKAKGKEKDVILLHGGNDSYYEEFFLPMLYLVEHGFTVYLFEGSGQGGVMRVQGKHFTYEWEHPVKAVLDYFNLDDVTIIGASLGGMLAPRAAAFEKRIGRVIAWSVFPNFKDVILSVVGKKAKLAGWLIDHNFRGIINAVFGKMAKKEEIIRWGLEHGKYAYEAKDAFSYAKKMDRFQMMDIADQITQDILIVGANKDHFIPYTMVGKEIAALKNVRSFTDKEDVCNHCNCGNVKLTFDTFMSKVVKHPDRAEADRFFNFPYAAVEETLSNAVYHRAYDEREPIEVRVENDRIEIVSFPGSDRSVTIEGLKSYRVSNRRYRNRRIGGFLKELHLTEERNTGFKKILDALEAKGSPKPEFETDEDKSYFITRLFVHEAFAKITNNDITPSTANSTPFKVVDSEFGKLELRNQILILIQKEPTITKKQMSNILGVSMYALKKELAAMSAEHVAEFVGFSRNGKWVVY